MMKSDEDTIINDFIFDNIFDNIFDETVNKDPIKGVR